MIEVEIAHENYTPAICARDSGRKTPDSDFEGKLAKMYGPPPYCKRFEVNEKTVRVNVVCL